MWFVTYFENQDLTGEHIHIATWADSEELAREFIARQAARWVPDLHPGELVKL